MRFIITAYLAMHSLGVDLGEQSTSMFQFLEQPFFIGVWIGLGVAVPIGPVGLLCIRRTLSNGIGAGLASGFGAATVHFCYGMTALCGMSTLCQLINGHRPLAQAISGLIIIALSVRIFCKSSAKEPVAIKDPNGRGIAAYLTTALLALSNPMTILGLASNLTAFGLVATGFGWQAGAGMFCGSIAWWLVLCGAVATVRHHVGPQTTAGINRSAAAAMALLGISTVVGTM